MPTLEALWQEYRNRGLIVLGVSVDRDAPRPLLDPYVGRLGLTFPVLLDAELKAAQAWRVTGLPATFLVRPGGDAVGMAFGAREWNSAEMRELIEPMLPHRQKHGGPRNGPPNPPALGSARAKPERSSDP
jgi:hypothetical protein